MRLWLYAEREIRLRSCQGLVKLGIKIFFLLTLFSNFRLKLGNPLHSPHVDLPFDISKRPSEDDGNWIHFLNSDLDDPNKMLRDNLPIKV